ncbi:hypothetical protein AKJ58_00470 [candidate division MSBL1 archaeon SCGC-AAA385D11]|uniref:Uncharacterized protein n=1 Tax=candidate division MSBL1 archaeon SCGC-AAA385D11 TaxID=1698286 RepID=A0A133VP76_9EURY|nr:hypothetical protein AKJ58_00470 [candidate division MSBL1 archaeon SCGC-AAA385D11]
MRKSGLNKSELEAVLTLLLAKIQVLPIEDYDRSPRQFLAKERWKNYQDRVQVRNNLFMMGMIQSKGGDDGWSVNFDKH